MKHVVFIAYRFPPCTAFPTAAARAEGLAYWLHDFGWHAVVVAPSPGIVCNCDGCRSGTLPDTTQARYNVLRVTPTLLAGAVPDNPAVATRPAHKVLRVGRAMLGSMDATSTWPEEAARGAMHRAAGSGASIVLTTIGPFSSLWAGRRAAASTSLPLVVDVRDALAPEWNLGQPLSFAYLGRSRRILRRAAAVVEVTPEHAECEAAWLGRPVGVVRSGFDPRHWNVAKPTAPPANPEMEVVFAGRLIPGYRTPVRFLEGLAEFRRASPSARVRVRYFGRDRTAFFDAARRHGVQGLVSMEGFLAQSELRHALSTADVLLLLTNDVGDSGVPGGKFYDYLAARRPILAVPGGDHYVDSTLRRLGVGTAASAPGEIANALSFMYAQWESAGAPSYNGSDEVDEFSIVESARALSKVLSAAMGDHHA